MDNANSTVLRVFNNNVVLVRTRGTEEVLVGRGIGFGCRVGQPIQLETTTQSYIAVSEERRKFLEAVQDVDSSLFNTISAAVDLAADLLGKLHPSVYLLLSDHLVFAAQRASEGEIFQNTLTEEIQALFPTEYSAAEMILHFINSRLTHRLPESEAGLIALHLKAARSGATVKQPLEQANQLDQIMAKIGNQLTIQGIKRPVDPRLIAHIAWLVQYLRRGQYRLCPLQKAVEKYTPDTYQLATELMKIIVGTVTELPSNGLAGETAFLSLFLEGWKQADEMGKTRLPEE